MAIGILTLNPYHKILKILTKMHRKVPATPDLPCTMLLVKGWIPTKYIIVLSNGFLCTY